MFRPFPISDPSPPPRCHVFMTFPNDLPPPLAPISPSPPPFLFGADLASEQEVVVGRDDEADGVGAELQRDGGQGGPLDRAHDRPVRLRHEDA